MSSAVVSSDNKVVAIVSGSTSALGVIAPGARIVAIPDGVTVEVGYVYANGVFSAPAPSTVMSKRDFLVRFTQAERLAIRAQMATDPVIADANQLMELSEAIDVTDEYAVQYVGYLATQGLIAAERVAEILAPVAG